MAMKKPKNVPSLSDAVKDLDKADAAEQKKNKAVITTKPAGAASATTTAPAKRGRGTRTVVPKKSVIAYIPEGMYYQLEELCKRSGMSKNAVFSKALYDYLENENKRILGNN